MENLETIIAVLIALSVASERLVEIIKGFFKWLDKENEDEQQERFRKIVLQLMAVVAGIVTSLLAYPAMSGLNFFPKEKPGQIFMIIALGLLASGGSGFWNSFQTYVRKAKDLKSTEEKIMKIDEEMKLKNLTQGKQTQSNQP
jgi:hypothetical protein